MGLNMKGVTVSGRALASNVSGSSFSITPSVESKSTWDLSSDGPLNLGTYGEWTIVPDGDITVDTKMWGAGGARGFLYTQTYATGSSSQGAGGSGGYSNASIVLKAGVSYILRVGQGGARVNTINSATYLAGGVNATVYGGTQGGGYSGLFKTSVTQGNALLMAGGGGGGGDQAFSGVGGGGGGTSGTPGGGAFNGQGGQGGTQVAGGASSPYNSATGGSALTGGRGATDASSNASLGGGGGGYFGGGGGNVGGGGAGSGHVSSNPDVISGSTTAADYATPANPSDPDRNGSAQGGNGTIGNTGADGRVIITLA